MKNFRRLVFFGFAFGCAFGAAADDSHPSLYSFSDLYRMTVAGTAPQPVAPVAAETHQVRVASVQSAAPATAEFRFTIAPVPGPGRWTLILAGLAAAAWVAHRRLTRAM